MLDCNGGLHVLPNHPLEMNFNLRGAKFAANFIAQEIEAKVKCATADIPDCADAVTDEIVSRHFIPSMHMLLNNAEPLRARRHLPDECQKHQPPRLCTHLLG